MAIPFNPTTDVPSTVTTAEQECYRINACVGSFMINKKVQLYLNQQVTEFNAFEFDRKYDTTGALWDFFSIALKVDPDIQANSQGLRTWEYAQGLYTPADGLFPANWK